MDPLDTPAVEETIESLRFQVKALECDLKVTYGLSSYDGSFREAIYALIRSGRIPETPEVQQWLALDAALTRWESDQT